MTISKSLLNDCKKIIIDKQYTEEKIPFIHEKMNLKIFEELTIWVYCQKVAASHDYMYCTYYFWKDLHYTEWLNLFYQFISIHEQGKTAFGIECFMQFFYKFLKVDLISVYAETEMPNNQIKTWILEDFVESPGRLYLDNRPANSQLLPHRYNLTLNELMEIGQRLILEGAYEAEEINPEHHREFRNTVEIFWVQGPAPKSWKWAEKYKKV